MLKYDNYKVSFAEVPWEISLYITITNCPIHCPNCNSKHLWSDTGSPLNWNNLNSIILANKGITCVTLGGGDSLPKEINQIAKKIKSNTDLKVCWYSGANEISKDIELRNFDMIKIGPFNGKPLNDPNTNQKMYEIIHTSDGFKLIDITYKFHRL